MATEPRPSCRKTISGAAASSTRSHWCSMRTVRPCQASSAKRVPVMGHPPAARDPAAREERRLGAAGRRRSRLLLPLAQAEALDLAGGGLGQLVDELDEARVL